VLLDTGATDSFFREFFRSVLKKKQRSSAKILIADATTIKATESGVLPAYVLNTTGNENVGLGAAIDIPGLVVPKLDQELIAVTHFFENLGYEIHLRPQGTCEFSKVNDDGELEVIPIRWDAALKGFYLDIIVTEDETLRELASAHVLDLMDLRSTERVRARNAATFSRNLVPEVLQLLQDGYNAHAAHQLRASASKHTDPLNGRLDLTGHNAGLSRDRAAKLFSHIGCTAANCWVCRMVKGTKPYKTKIPDDLRVVVDMPNYRFTIDFVQWSCRSTHGNAYTACIRGSFGMYYGLHVVYKDDIYAAMSDFLTVMRADDRFNWMQYPFAVEFLCDRDSTWVNSKLWDQHIQKVHGVRMRPSDPADKNSNASAELANKEMERRTKSLLYSRNLPPYYWEDCYNQAAWLKARLQRGGESFDGDNPRPLERTTNFKVSRKQISKELSAFIPIGTPAITWNAEANKLTAKGSDIHSRARWGIAKGMDRHIPQFFCPFTMATFHTGSYTAIDLAEGINWYQFLGLKGPAPPRTIFIPMQPDYKLLITLPELAERDRVQMPAVTGVKQSNSGAGFVQVLDPAGRIFAPNNDGNFQDTGQNVYDPDNKEEKAGALGLLTSASILKNGWNNFSNNEGNANFLKMTMATRPHDFIGSIFNQDFEDGITYAGRVLSYNKLKKWWKVQYSDGMKADFDDDDIVHYVINKKSTPIPDQDGHPRGHNMATAVPPLSKDAEQTQPTPAPEVNAPEVLEPAKYEPTSDDASKLKQKRRRYEPGDTISASPTIFDGQLPGSYSNEHPNRVKGTITNLVKKGVVNVLWEDDETTAVQTKDIRLETPTETAKRATGGAIPLEYIFKLTTTNTARFQYLPARNERGESPPSADIADVTRRVTYDTDKQEIVEDASGSEVAEHGCTELLPRGVQNICTYFYFSANEKVPQPPAFYLSKRGDTISAVMKNLGLREELQKTYERFLTKDFLRRNQEPTKKVQDFNRHKITFQPGTKFPRPRDSQWTDLVRAYRKRQKEMHPPWKVAALTAKLMANETHMMLIRKKLSVPRNGRHAYFARRAMAHVHFKSKIQRDARMQSSQSRRSNGTRELKQENTEELRRAAAAAKLDMNNATTIWEALAGPNAKQWVDVLTAEDKKLDQLGVFVHDIPRRILRQLGITEQFIVPSRYVPTLKTLPTGAFDRAKIRKIIQGHKYAMQKNVHYDRTFTPTPSLDSSRFMAGKGVGEFLVRVTFDIMSAFQQAPHEGVPLGVKYPKGFERWEEGTGDELFAVLLRL
jgi:hypothetical protein